MLVIGVSLLIGVIASSAYFAFHSTGALEIPLQEVYGLTDRDVGWLFTMYSTPNVVMTAVSGVAIDRYGLKFCGVLLLATILAGTTMVAAAPGFGSTRMVPMMLAG
eukprot:5254706-Prymnesium_polylepis.1